MGAYRKAIIGALLAGSAALTTALGDGAVSLLEWSIILGALIAGFAGVYATRNDAPPIA